MLSPVVRKEYVHGTLFEFDTVYCREDHASADAASPGSWEVPSNGGANSKAKRRPGPVYVLRADLMLDSLVARLLRPRRDRSAAR